MRRAGFIALAMVAGCAADGKPSATQPESIALRNAGFEASVVPGARCPADWACAMHADPNSFRFVLDGAQPAEGKQSLCIERVTHEPWAVASQSVQAEAYRGRRLRFSIAMRAEALGGPGAGPWVLVNGPQGMLTHDERVEMLGASWQRRSIEFAVPAQATGIEVGATLLGAGRVCIDDARLEPA
jgi:hypothetical protein